MAKIIFQNPCGTKIETPAQIGYSLMEIARDAGLVEGACGGSLACATCHIIFDDKTFSLLKEKSEEEEEMLDLAFHLEDNSRLGCQIIMTPSLDGAIIRIPPEN